MLTSSSTVVTVPASVVIPAGSANVGFSATSGAVTSDLTVALNATLNGVASAFSLSVVSSPAPVSVACTPATVRAGTSSTCSVTLSKPAAAGGLVVALTSNNSKVNIPATVTASVGSNTATFTAAAAVDAGNSSATITATAGTTARATVLNVFQTLSATMLCSPATIQTPGTSTCTITLANPATANTPVTLSSSTASLSVPASISIGTGMTSATFTVSAAAVTSNTAAAVNASVGTSQTLTLVPSHNPAAALPGITVPGPQTARPGKLTAFTIAASDPAGLAVSLSVSGLPQGAIFDAGSGLFSWVPQTSQVGTYTVQFTATNTAHASATQSVVINVGSDTPVVVSLANAASFVDEGCSPGAVATLLGGGFVNTPAKSAATSPIPFEVNGLRVKMNGNYVPVFYASESQVNIQCPQTSPGAPLTLVVESKTGSSPPTSSTVQYATPGIFTLDGSGKGQGAVLIDNSAAVAMAHAEAPSRPAQPGDSISIYATGLGPVTVTLPSGQSAPLDKLVRTVALVDVLIGGVHAEVTFAGLAPGFAGLYQVNAKIPADAPAGDAISLQIATHVPDGSIAQSNVVTMAVAAH
jgi:uncharacterized protein (TIGR03437 family)